jgi:hypothetical protein
MTLLREDDDRPKLFGLEVLLDIPGLFVEDFRVSPQGGSVSLAGLGIGMVVIL